MYIVYFTQPDEYPAIQDRSLFCSLMYHKSLKPCPAHNQHSISVYWMDKNTSWFCALLSNWWAHFPSSSINRLSRSLCAVWHWRGSAMVTHIGNWPRRMLTWLRATSSWKVSLPQAEEDRLVGFCSFPQIWLNFRRIRFSWTFSSLHIESHFLSQRVNKIF